MCIAIVKSKGINLPEKDMLKICFKNNPDGAGFAYWRDNKIYIHKGFFTFDGFYHSLIKANIKKEESALIHFRVATHGKINLENCHPFPITNNFFNMTMPKLKTTNDVLIHNGKLNIEIQNKNYSDSMHFAKALVGFDRTLNKFFIEHIIKPTEKNKRGNRIGILKNDNSTELYGVGWINENGLFFSNDSYKENSSYKKQKRKNIKTKATQPIFINKCHLCQNYTTSYAYMHCYSFNSYFKTFICEKCVEKNRYKRCVKCNHYSNVIYDTLCCKCQNKSEIINVEYL